MRVSKIILLMLAACWIAHAQCGTLVVNPTTGRLDCIGIRGSGYTTTFSGVTGLTVLAATHGQGTKVTGVCFDNASPANTIAQTAGFPTVNTSGDIVFAWSGSKTGYCIISNLGNQQGPPGPSGTATYTTVSFSATPQFDASTSAARVGIAFQITLTGDVTSSTLVSATTGEIITFRVCQDGTGGHSFVPPTNVLNMGTISSSLSTCSNQTFVYDGTNAQAIGVMIVTGGTGNSITIPGTTGSFSIGAATAAGSPAQVNFPTSTGNASQFLMTDGGTPQQLSWGNPDNMFSGYEVGQENAASVLVTADLTNHSFKINNKYARTLDEAICWSDSGSQTVTIKIGATTKFSITCVNSINFGTTDGTTGYIIAASMASTSIAAHAQLDLSGTANGSTKDIKLYLYGF